MNTVGLLSVIAAFGVASAAGAQQDQSTPADTEAQTRSSSDTITGSRDEDRSDVTTDNDTTVDRVRARSAGTIEGEEVDTPAERSADTTRSASAQDQQTRESQQGQQSRQTRQSQSATQGGQDQQQSRQAQQDQQSQQSSRQARAGQGGAAVPVVMLLVPVAQSDAAANATQNGCWARLYDNTNYTGDALTLVGPVDMPNMVGPFGVNWSDIDSIQTGPRAAVTIYDNQNFRDRAAKIEAGKQVPEINQRMGYFDNVNSIRINCTGSSTGRSGG